MAEIIKRNQQKKEDTWDLDPIFKSNEDWQKAFDEVAASAAALKSYKGRLGESGSVLLEALRNSENIGRKLSLVHQYAFLRYCEDGANSLYQGMDDKVSSYIAVYQSDIAFFRPEILSIGKDKLENFYKEEKELEHYRQYFDVLYREQEHVLSDKEEAILAAASKLAMAPRSIYVMLTDADLKFGKVKDKDGNELELTRGRFVSYQESNDRVLRENSFNAFYDVYVSHKNALAAAYSASVDKDIFFARTAKYQSCIEAGLFPDNIPVEVYKNLISAVHKSLPDMHRYVALRKKRLGVEQLHMYDVYTPIVEDVDTNISYEAAQETVLKAVAPLGEDYAEVVRRGFAERWIDKYENEGKTSGAFSAGTYDTNPYMLLNFDGKISDMFTLAHEFGHSMHSYYSIKNQSPTYAGYPIFLAEVASTVNEALLMDYLLKTTEEPKMKEYLLNYFLEQFKSTLFRQTMFAEFEMITHESAEKGEPLTVDFLKDLYLSLNKKYFGENMISDEKIAYEWSRIPHFYRPFYVYKYATGYSAAIAFSNKILKEGKPAVDAYKTFLSSGSSDYPIEILKKAGVDMSSPKPIEEALKVFSDILTQMENM